MSLTVIVRPDSPDFYKDTKWERKPHGLLFVDGREVASTLQCPHCNTHFVSRKGSGIQRAYCYQCKSVTCGRPECDACRPFEKQLEAFERAMQRG